MITGIIGSIRSTQIVHKVYIVWEITTAVFLSVPQAIVYKSRVDNQTEEYEDNCVSDFAKGWGNKVSN